MTPRYTWTPASEPPDTGRSVLVWRVYDSFFVPGDWAVSRYVAGKWGLDNVTHWRDIEPPEEA